MDAIQMTHQRNNTPEKRASEAMVRRIANRLRRGRTLGHTRTLGFFWGAVKVPTPHYRWGSDAASKRARAAFREGERRGKAAK